MTRILSELLGGREPAFRAGLRQLEQASGLPSEDIRLTTELDRRARRKLRELNLDPANTTAEELFQALQIRLRRDGQVIDGLTSASMAGVAALCNRADMPRQVYVLKNAVAKKLLKQRPPRRLMKQLGYRSLDSMLKHEAPALLLAGAKAAETVAWHKGWAAGYKKLLPTDFECRPAQVVSPEHQRWHGLAADYVAQRHHNVLVVPELGAVILLPLSGQAVEGASLAAVLLALHAISDMRATSSFLKLQQVRADFGATVGEIAAAAEAGRSWAPSIGELARVPLSWPLVHYFLGGHQQGGFMAEGLFEPHLQAEDLEQKAPADVLASLHPFLEFWQDTAHLGFHHRGQPAAAGQAVSFNPLDGVLSLCNHTAFSGRHLQNLRHQLWQELLARYLRQPYPQKQLEQQLQQQLGQLTEEAYAI